MAPVMPTVSGGAWLSVSSATETPPGYTFSVSVIPASLAVGTYQGSVLVSPSYGPPATLPVTLTVTQSAVPMISANSVGLTFSAQTFTSPPTSQTIALTSSSGPTPFSVTLQPGTWLEISPMSGTTPATLTVTWNPEVTSQIYYQQRVTPGSILISGPGNTITIPATFNVTGVQTFQTYLGASGMGPDGLVFSAQTGSGPQAQTINVDPSGTLSATADQAWIGVAATTAATVSVTVNPAELAPGVYDGTVTIGEPGLASIAVPVVLGVWSTSPPLAISTTGMTFIDTVGEPGPAFQTAQVTSGGVPLPLTIAVGGSWLDVVDHYSAPTPAQLIVGIVGEEGIGQYNGSFTIQAPGSSVYVPVTLLVEPGPVTPPVVSQVVNAASGIAGGVSPGEIVSIRGYGAGASAVGGLRLNPSGMVVPEINGVQVTFDGRPAPLLFTSANQTNVVVPYELTNQTSTAMQVVYAATGRDSADGGVGAAGGSVGARGVYGRFHRHGAGRGREPGWLGEWRREPGGARLGDFDLCDRGGADVARRGDRQRDAIEYHHSGVAGDGDDWGSCRGRAVRGIGARGSGGGVAGERGGAATGDPRGERAGGGDGGRRGLADGRDGSGAVGRRQVRFHGGG